MDKIVSVDQSHIEHSFRNESICPPEQHAWSPLDGSLPILQSGGDTSSNGFWHIDHGIGIIDSSGSLSSATYNSAAYLSDEQLGTSSLDHFSFQPYDYLCTNNSSTGADFGFVEKKYVWSGDSLNGISRTDTFEALEPYWTSDGCFLDHACLSLVSQNSQSTVVSFPNDSPVSSAHTLSPATTSMTDIPLKLEQNSQAETWKHMAPGSQSPRQHFAAVQLPCARSTLEYSKRARSSPPAISSKINSILLHKLSQKGRLSKSEDGRMRTISCTQPNCDKTFRWSKDLIRHTRSSHREEVIRWFCGDLNCKFSTQGFPRKDKFVQHYRTHVVDFDSATTNFYRLPPTSTTLRCRSTSPQRSKRMVSASLNKKRLSSSNIRQDGESAQLGANGPDLSASSVPLAILPTRSRPSDTSKSVDTLSESGARNYSCSSLGCGSTFVQLSNLRRHQKSVHNETEAGSGYTCPVAGCGKVGKVWNRMDNFKQHLANKHQIDVKNTIEVDRILRSSMAREEDGALPFIVTTLEAQPSRKRPADKDIGHQSSLKTRRLSKPSSRCLSDIQDLEVTKMVQDADFDTEGIGFDDLGSILERADQPVECQPRLFSLSTSATWPNLQS